MPQIQSQKKRVKPTTKKLGCKCSEICIENFHQKSSGTLLTQKTRLPH